MNWRPDITVAAIIERDGRFLLVEERIQSRQVLNQPAGHVEIGESIIAAASRETLEESAWDFRPESLIGIYVWRHPRSGRDTLRFAFTGALGAFDPLRPLDHPVIGTHWLTRDDLQSREAQLRSPLVLRCIDDFIAGQRLPLSALCDFAPSR